MTFAMFEMRQETDYVRHHIQKITAFFLAMRHFRDQLEEQGHQIAYYTLDDNRNRQDLSANMQQVIESVGAKQWSYQWPDEYRLDQQLVEMREEWDIPCEVADTEHFYTSRDEFGDIFEGKSSFLMEKFYRRMRKKHDVLMESENPVGGEWNYDAENRKKFPKKETPPDPYIVKRDVSHIVSMIEAAGVETIGEINTQSFLWPVTRAEGEKSLSYFTEKLLSQFGSYQDAMTSRSDFLFHSRLSFLLNSKILSPLEVVAQAEKAYEKDKEKVGISNVEGFIRQILGWREYMRGLYWHQMPDYAQLNYFEHENELPSFYWTGDTRMNCMKHAIRNSLDNAYAHHIQRLMITGNFALLAGVHPDQVEAWYLGVYIDAIEWVEMPNTRGMSQFADGGKVATKPYIASANYIHKMSDYCKDCYYDKKKKVGERACPFNSLYWRFISQHENKLSANFRMSMMYRVWDKYGAEEKSQILGQAEEYLRQIDEL